MAEHGILICATKENVPEPPVPSQTSWCHVCAVELWVSNSMVRHLADGDVRPACIDCTQGVIKTQAEYEVKLLPEQERELEEAGLLGDVKRFVSKMNSNRN